MEEETIPTEVVPTETEVTAPVTEPVVSEPGVEDTDLRSRLSETDYGYVQSLREEAKTNRQAADRYKTAFDGFDDETTDAFLQSVKLIQEDPKQAYEIYKDLTDALANAAGITQAEAKEIIAEVVADETTAPQAVTVDKLDELLEARENKKRETEAQLEAKRTIDSKIDELGYKPETRDFNDLLFYATQEAEGTPTEKLEAAHVKMQADRQAIIDEFLQGEAAKSGQFVPLTSGSSPVATQEAVKTINDGAKRARAALEALKES